LIFDVEEKSYSPEASIKYLQMPVYNANKNFENLALVCAVNNRSRLVYQDDKFGIQGEPTEAAMKVLAEKMGRFAGNVYDYTKNA
jgi:Ca2+-transporting ATPase